MDHRPEAILPIDTVLQPKIKKKKSVSKLEVKDTNKASKYLLTTQEQDNTGQVETKLIKVSRCLCNTHNLHVTLTDSKPIEEWLRNFSDVMI